MALKRRRIDAAFRDSALTQLSQLSIAADPDTDSYVWTTILQLAGRVQLTLYDAAYLELAQRRRLPLATLDRELRDASAALGISLLGVTPANYASRPERPVADLRPDKNPLSERDCFWIFKRAGGAPLTILCHRQSS